MPISHDISQSISGTDALDFTLLTVTASPHIRGDVTVARIMYSVLLALLPATVAGVYLFGLGALQVILVAVFGAVATEALVQPLLGKKISVQDGSAAVTGLLLALTLPPGLPWWMVLTGSFVAIVLGKAVYGGLGNNPFNPALIARVVLLVSWPVHLTRWQNPGYLFARHAQDAISAATPLGMLKSEGLASIGHLRLLDLFFGYRAGCIGEVSIVALLIGVSYLLWKGYVTWHIPVSCLVTAFLASGFFWIMKPGQYANPIFHILSGGLVLGACFMATDMVTSPITSKGMLIFGAGIGLFTIIIRLFGGYPEGTSFAILIMNAVCPLIDKYTMPKGFGRRSAHA
ncbi:MAG: RnfABCDGE type electron transport complex subunit D [bacterium]